MSNLLDLSRRQVMTAAGAVLSAASLPLSLAEAQEAKPLPPAAAWKNAANVIVHSADTIEMKRGVSGTSVITPLESLYVRNNVAAPDAAIVANPDAWSVSIEGVATPKTFTVRDLKGMGVQTVATVLQCSGNGRAFFDNKPTGTQWTVGAAGCVIWSGVALKDVVAALGGVAPGMSFMTGTGGETLPEGLDPKSLIVERSVPTAAMADAILAWEANGQPIPLAHGGPLRLIVPGYHGVNNIKYIKRLAFTATETDAKIHKTSYRVHAVGVKGAPDQPSMWEMPVKSWVTNPATAASGKVTIVGVAFGGINAVASVEVSVDAGASWQPATFVGPDLGRYAWRQFALTTDLKPGTYRVVSRATDAKGSAQPENFEPNGSGYGHNGWKSHGIDVTVA